MFYLETSTDAAKYHRATPKITYYTTSGRCTRCILCLPEIKYKTARYTQSILKVYFVIWERGTRGAPLLVKQNVLCIRQTLHERIRRNHGFRIFAYYKRHYVFTKIFAEKLFSVFPDTVSRCRGFNNSYHRASFHRPLDITRKYSYTNISVCT